MTELDSTDSLECHPAEGLQFLRSHDIIHRDLKPQVRNHVVCHIPLSTATALCCGFGVLWCSCCEEQEIYFGMSQNLLLGELFGGFETPEKENDPTDAEGDAADEQDKAQNVRRKLKIGDFGFARHIDQGALAETLVGRSLTDSYACGVGLIEL